MNSLDETNFISQFLETLSTRQVKYPKDFSPPSQTRPKPIVKSPSIPTSSKSKPIEKDAPIQVVVKTLKGNQTHTVQIKNSETIHNLKEKITKNNLIYTFKSKINIKRQGFN
jgi:hypothetical protein